MFQTATCPSTRHGPPYMRTAPQTHRRTAGLSEQFRLFADNPRFPEGLRYAAEFVSPAIERELIARRRGAAAAAVSVRPIRGQAAGGVVRLSLRLHAAPSAGGRSDPAMARSAHRTQVEAFGGPATRIAQVLCTEYDTGVGIGWHRDKPHFDRIFGLSLGSPCKFRFRRPAGEKWQRFTLDAAPRSIYMMAGDPAAAGSTAFPPSRRRAIRSPFGPWWKPEHGLPDTSTANHPGTQ